LGVRPERAGSDCSQTTGKLWRRPPASRVSGCSRSFGEVGEAEAERLRREAIRAESDRVVGHAAEHAQARDELDEIGTPLGDLRRVG